MRRLLSILCGALVLAALAACDNSPGSVNMLRGSGNIVKESRQGSGFQEVSLATDRALTVEQTGGEGLTLEGDDNILPLITTEVRNGRLTIGTRPNTSFSPTRRLSIRVTVKDIRYLSTNSSGDVGMAAVRTETITVESVSSGSIRLGPVTASRCAVKIASSGNVTVQGAAPALEVTKTSSGNFDGRALQSKQATVHLSSSGDATVRVSDTLNATLDSNGSVKYLGNPQVTQNASSLGRVQRIGE